MRKCIYCCNIFRPTGHHLAKYVCVIKKGTNDLPLRIEIFVVQNRIFHATSQIWVKINI